MNQQTEEVKQLTKLKAYIVYSGDPGWYQATLVLENGWAPFGHLCSHPGFMPGDLIVNRPERQQVFVKMGYVIELTDAPILDKNAPAELIALHKAKAWQPMADEYARVEQELFPCNQ